MAVDWVRLRLDVDAFDPEPFGLYLERARQAGFGFTTMAEVGDDPEHRRALYELNRTCSADIPERGEFYTFTQYGAERLDVPGYEPRGVVLAVREDAWVGMSALSLHPTGGYAVSEMTGVLAPFRGSGLSVAMKVLAIGFARSAGVRQVRAAHHPRNTAAIAMNRRLGFVPDPDG